MAFSRLSCPECGSVLRPARPIADGAKVKCPKCSTVFVAGEDAEELEEVEEQPRKKPAKKAPPAGGAKKPAPAVKAKEPEKKKEEEIGTYGYLKDGDEEEDKPEVNYAPDESVKDLRGPAIVKLTTPATRLQLAGAIAALTTLLFALLLIIPKAFPIKEEMKPADLVTQPAPTEKEKAAKKTPKIPIYALFGQNLDPLFALPWYSFTACIAGLAGLMFYSAVVVAGGVKMQNLESRPWSIASCVMAILPINTLGISCLFGLLAQYVFGYLMEDDSEFPTQVQMLVAAVLWLASAAIGGAGMKVLMDEEVIGGFEYDPE